MEVFVWGLKDYFTIISLLKVYFPSGTITIEGKS